MAALRFRESTGTSCWGGKKRDGKGERDRRLTVCQQTQLGEKRGCPHPPVPPTPLRWREQEGRRGAEINDTEAGFNKAGTEEEKEGGGMSVMGRGSRRGDRTRAMASVGGRELRTSRSSTST